MERIIGRFYDSDGYTYSCTWTNSFYAESPEAALVIFEELCKSKTDFSFAGMQFYSHNYLPPNEMPQFLSLDEWFEEYGTYV